MATNLRNRIKPVDPERFQFALGVYHAAAALRGPTPNPENFGFAQIFARYPDFGVVTHRLLVGDNHWTLDWTLTFQPPGKDQRGFRALDVVEADAKGLVTRKDTFFDYAQVKAAFEAA